ncbi:hypothetical protein [Solimonas sp. SE-A11]|uniref:hypothetical protein n=1 Tax=Solimonas sp. SE-A11 TaxID=3054954 RepID=UPI00259D0418|nr:hypothetical protein [Solimonas sp. SE-A11]MDM4772585.1 hypothetical protein [Solimonas sp. SE-A11]
MTQQDLDAVSPAAAHEEAGTPVPQPRWTTPKITSFAPVPVSDAQGASGNPGDGVSNLT